MLKHILTMIHRRIDSILDEYFKLFIFAIDKDVKS